MPHPSPAADSEPSLQAENDALRVEIGQLRAQLAAAAEPLAPLDRYAQSQARFRTVFENAPLGQKIITPDLTIRQVNQAVVNMLGYEQPEELIGRRILEFAHPGHRADWQELQTRLWQHKLPAFSLETCLVRADGSSFWCQVHSVLFPDDGAELGYTILEDISERKRLEASLKRVYDAQETILQLATHDLKGPVAQIELLADLLQREVNSRSGQGPPPPEMMHYLDLIQAACFRARSLLDDVLYVGDLDQNGLEKRATDLSSYLAAQAELHQLEARTKGITLVLDLPTDPVQIRLHPDKFGRVIGNLLANALKFTPAGGTVTLGLRLEKGKPRFMVRDTGIGIPGKLHAQLFEKFNPTRRAGLHGETTTGLGLFIARQIVELHGGAIWLESQEQKGSTFFIELA
ncbi:PAS domain-containing sensor histidine kinase [Hymenobacter jeollabukensis]|uniref:histidine kinase n=1 Tax=Hymenobacter jeollabukensis TaxID=2025313 RepID=A0A5R8WX52_9BACT|nr:PAS domain-containing sensor histidine kinase [Hymenobacter jeollabukensis]TLM96939.1 PAS domain S-box protein [Hymenobacter jeollabukensis]